MTRDENRADLQRHADDFRNRKGFTYTVLDPGGRHNRCIYIYPLPDSDPAARSFPGCGRAYAHLDIPLWRAVTDGSNPSSPVATVEYARRASASTSSRSARRLTRHSRTLARDGSPKALIAGATPEQRSGDVLNGVLGLSEDGVEQGCARVRCERGSRTLGLECGRGDSPSGWPLVRPFARRRRAGGGSLRDRRRQTTSPRTRDVDSSSIGARTTTSSRQGPSVRSSLLLESSS